MDNRHGSGVCMKVVQDEFLENNPWLVDLEKASEVLEIATGVLVNGGHSFFAAQVKEIQDDINEQIEGEKEWRRSKD